MRLLLLSLALAGSLPSAASAQSTKPRVDPPIFADAPKPNLGAPLSQRTLVTSPTPVKGALSWTIETRRVRHRFSVTALSPDGKLVATGGLDGIIRL